MHRGTCMHAVTSKGMRPTHGWYCYKIHMRRHGACTITAIHSEASFYYEFEWKLKVTCLIRLHPVEFWELAARRCPLFKKVLQFSLKASHNRQSWPSGARMIFPTFFPLPSGSLPVSSATMNCLIDSCFLLTLSHWGYELGKCCWAQ